MYMCVVCLTPDTMVASACGVEGLMRATYGDPDISFHT